MKYVIYQESITLKTFGKFISWIHLSRINRMLCYRDLRPRLFEATCSLSLLFLLPPPILFFCEKQSACLACVFSLIYNELLHCIIFIMFDRKIVEWTKKIEINDGEVIPPPMFTISVKRSSDTWPNVIDDVIVQQ